MLKVVDLKGKGLGKVYLETLCEKVAIDYVRNARIEGVRRFIYNADGTPYHDQGHYA